MTNKLEKLGTEISPQAFTYQNGNWYITLPRAIGRKGIFSIVAEWCGYCHKLASSLKEAQLQQPFQSYYVIGDKSDYTRKLMQAMGAQGYPTVFIIERNGKLTPYNGDRSPAALIEAVTGMKRGWLS